MGMMLGYTHSDKIWRLWDFEGNGGRGWPVNCSDVQFIESQNAWVKVFGPSGLPGSFEVGEDAISKAFGTIMGHNSGKLSPVSLGEPTGCTISAAGISSEGIEITCGTLADDLYRPEASGKHSDNCETGSKYFDIELSSVDPERVHRPIVSTMDISHETVPVSVGTLTDKFPNFPIGSEHSGDGPTMVDTA
ncbi:hypothetical protein HOY80DRAFT_1044947 [Tuber brumale]|nr:hypothetical protein HOY80DRAFT_1044947 [Tuber brumale]